MSILSTSYEDGIFLNFIFKNIFTPGVFDDLNIFSNSEPQSIPNAFSPKSILELQRTPLKNGTSISKKFVINVMKPSEIVKCSNCFKCSQLSKASQPTCNRYTRNGSRKMSNAQMDGACISAIIWKPIECISSAKSRIEHFLITVRAKNFCIRHSRYINYTNSPRFYFVQS